MGNPILVICQGGLDGRHGHLARASVDSPARRQWHPTGHLTFGIPLGQFDQLRHFVRSCSGDLLRYAVIALAAVAVLYAVWRLVHRRRRKPVPPEPDLRIDVPALGLVSPPAGAPRLEFYHVPVRLAAIVLAPVGRVRRLPPADQIHSVIDAIVPGLDEVAVSHESMLYYWPVQLSPRGFAHSFFKHARLPGDRGRGTRWCSVAGVFKMGNQPLMAGLIMSTESENSLSQVIIEMETKWLDVLRIKRGEW